MALVEFPSNLIGKLSCDRYGRRGTMLIANSFGILTCASVLLFFPCKFKLKLVDRDRPLLQPNNILVGRKPLEKEESITKLKEKIHYERFDFGMGVSFWGDL